MSARSEHSIGSPRPNSHLAFRLVLIGGCCLLGVWHPAVASTPDVCKVLITKEQPGVSVLTPLLNVDTDEVRRNLKANNKDMYFDAVETMYRFDIDNDGEEENVATTVEGSARTTGYVIYGAGWKARSYDWVGFDWNDDGIRWASVRYFVRYKNQTYVVWSDHTGRFLSHVSVYDKSSHRLLCKFGYGPAARTIIQQAKNKALCLDVLAGPVRYPAFDRSSSLQDDGCYDSGGPSCARPKGSALIDIDNDGKRDMVVQMEVTWGGGAGCDFIFLAIEDRKSGTLQKTAANKALMEATRKWGVCSRAASAPFRYQGAWYIENKYHETNVFDFHNVIRLNGERAEEICSFSVTKEPFIIE